MHDALLLVKDSIQLFRNISRANMELIQRLITLTVLLSFTRVYGYRYICANRLCLCKVINNGKDIRADCTKTQTLERVPIEEFSNMEYSMLSFVDMTGTRYCHSSIPLPVYDISAKIVCKRGNGKKPASVIDHKNNPAEYQHDYVFISRSYSAAVIISSVSGVLLIVITTGIGIWLHKVDYYCFILNKTRISIVDNT